MKSEMTAIELTGIVDKNQNLHLDNSLPFVGPKRVRVILLYTDDAEPTQNEWLRAAACNPAFDFLNDPEEDIYSLEDGKPFDDEI